MADVGPQLQEATAGRGDTEGDSGDYHMTPAAPGVVPENYYTALDGYVEDTGAEGSSRGPSEAPSIRSRL